MQDVTEAVPHLRMARGNMAPRIAFQNYDQTVRVFDLVDFADRDLSFRRTREPQVLNLKYARENKLNLPDSQRFRKG